MAKDKMQIVFASAECAPFVKTGGLGDVAGSLPAALVREGAEVIVMVPKYATISAEYTDKMEHLCDFYVPLSWRNEYCGLEKLELAGVTYLFLDNESYFKRDYPYGFFDDGERFAFFSKAICEAIQYLPEGFECDILHCNDWQTALVPVFLREFYQGIPAYERIKTVFSIHNMAFQGQFSDTLLDYVLGLGHIPAAAAQLRCDAQSINYMQAGLKYTDAITTVSPTYADEIQTGEYGEGLDWVMRDRSYALQGILNGIDTAAWDPATDKRIPANYSVADMSGKAECKAELQEELGLEVTDEKPLMVMVTRLTRQKGMDLVMYSLQRILEGGIQVAVLGTGDRDYEDGLRWFADQYPGQMCARIQFDPALSQRMYAGADLFLMPSKFEPCGLSQIISMRYGTLPVVRETGGLKDTVEPYNEFTGEGTGFTFANFNGEEMGDAVFRGARLFWDDKDAWNKLVKNAMERDYSWTVSAEKYLDLYFWLQPDVKRGNDPEPEVKAEAEEPKPAKKAPAKKPAAKKAAPKPTVAKAPETKAEEKADAKPTAKKPAAKKTTTKAAASDAAEVKAEEKPAAKPAAKEAPAKKAAPKARAAKKTEPKVEAKAETEPAVKDEPKPEAKPAAKTAAKKATATKTATAAKKTGAAAKKTAAKAPEAKAEAEKPEVKATAKPAAKKTAAKPAAKKAAAEPAKKTSATKPAAKKTTPKTK